METEDTTTPLSNETEAATGSLTPEVPLIRHSEAPLISMGAEEDSPSPEVPHFMDRADVAAPGIDELEAAGFNADAPGDEFGGRVGESSFPTVEEARFNSAISGTNPYSGKRKRWMAFAVAGFVAVLVIIFFSVNASNSSDKSASASSSLVQGNNPSTNPPPVSNQGTNVPPVSNPSPQAPNPSPHAPDVAAVPVVPVTPETPEELAYQQRVQDFIVSRGTTSRATLEDTTSPQFKAYRWIVAADPMKLAVPIEPRQVYFFEQRYILAVLYYALNGENWSRYKMGFLTASDVCDWNESFRTMSNNDDDGDFDEWTQGVVCNKMGLVDYIFMSGNNIAGSLPSEIGYLTFLEHLTLYNNTLTGNLPQEMERLVNLTFVSLDNNQLEGKIPAWINKWTQLEELGLGDNRLTGPIPALDGLVKLKELALNDNDLTGSIDVLNPVTTLQSIFLNDNGFSGTIDDNSLALLKDLTTLDLSNNFFQGIFPSHFYLITTVDLHNNQFSGPLPAVTHKDPPIEFLSLHHNDFSGAIPATMGFLLYLKHLDLSDNLLEGELHDSFNAMVSLEYLFLARNNLAEGRIPVVFALSNLKELSLARTNRNEQIPTWMGSFSNLVLLDLQDNSITGYIPDELGNLSELRFLLLNDNYLSGVIPESLAYIKRLKVAFFDQNDLDEDAVDFCWDGGPSNSDLITADCNDEFTCKCCTTCCSDDDETCNDAQLQISFDQTYTRDQYVFSENLIFNVVQ